MLSRDIAGKGLYPAIDPLLSRSKLLEPDTVGIRHYRAAIAVKQHLARYKELQDIIAMLGIEELSPVDRLIVYRPGNWSASSPSRFSLRRSSPACRA